MYWTSSTKPATATCRNDDSSIVGCIRNEDESEYKKLEEDFCLVVQGGKKIIITCILRNMAEPVEPVAIRGEEVEMVLSYLNKRRD